MPRESIMQKAKSICEKTFHCENKTTKVVSLNFVSAFNDLHPNANKILGVSDSGLPAGLNADFALKRKLRTYFLLFHSIPKYTNEFHAYLVIVFGADRFPVK